MARDLWRPRRRGDVRLLALDARLRAQSRPRARDHRRAGDDVPAAADRHEAAAQLHGDLPAGAWRMARGCCIRARNRRAALLTASDAEGARVMRPLAFVAATVLM